MVVHAHDRYVGADGAASHWHSNLTLRWMIVIDGDSRESKVSVRADNASERGVPLPPAWHNALRCMDLGSRAEKAGHSLEAVDVVSEFSCCWIGNPRVCRTPSGDEPCSGTICCTACTIVRSHELCIDGAHQRESLVLSCGLFQSRRN